jgi:hypothetical protein
MIGLDEFRTDNPAYNGAYLQALRSSSPEGEGVAEGLEFLLHHGPDFSFDPPPTDEWAYLKRFVEVFAKDEDLATSCLRDVPSAFLSGVEIGVALGAHERA